MISETKMAYSDIDSGFKSTGHLRVMSANSDGIETGQTAKLSNHHASTHALNSLAVLSNFAQTQILDAETTKNKP